MPSPSPSTAPTFVPQEDGSLVTGKNPRDDRWVVKAEGFPPGIRAIRIEALTDKSMKRNGPGRASNGNLALSDIRVFAKKIGEEGKGKPVKLINPRADHQQNTTNLSIASSIDGDKRKTGWAVDGQIGKDHVCVFEFGAGGERGRDGIYFRIGLFRERQSRHRASPVFPVLPVGASAQGGIEKRGIERFARGGPQTGRGREAG